MSSSSLSNTPDITFERFMRSPSFDAVTTETASALYAEINAAEEEMAKDALERYRADQQRIRKARQELNACIRHRLRVSRGFYRVPTEVWAIIFKLVCPTSSIPHKRRLDSLDWRDPRLVIGRVCSLWREIIESLPEMWTPILLKDWDILGGSEPWEDFHSFLTARCNTLSDILRHSMRLPLHIKLSAPRPSLSLITPLVDDVVHILVKHSDRWASLVITDSYEEPIGRAIESSVELLDIYTYPLLERLDYGWDRVEYPETDSDIDEARAPDHADHFPGPTKSLKMPRLRSLNLDTFTPSDACMRWSQLTRVKLEDIRVEFYRYLLPRLISVVELNIKGDAEWDESDDIPADGFAEFVLPELQKLCLHHWPGETHFFARMKAPQLRDLTLNRMSSGEAQALARFITRSECSITTFAIGDAYSRRDVKAAVKSNCFGNLLFSMPDLQALKVSCRLYASVGDFDRAVELLVGPLSLQNGSGVLSYCPGLNDVRIWLHGRWYGPSSATSFINMVETRWNASRLAGSGLRAVGGIPDLGEVEFTKDDGLKEALLQRLEAMRVEGLQMTLAEVPS